MINFAREKKMYGYYKYYPERKNEKKNHPWKGNEHMLFSTLKKKEGFLFSFSFCFGTDVWYNFTLNN